MITLEIDDDKVITIAMVPYVPNAYVIEQVAGLEQRGDYDRVKLLPQIQILKRKTLEPIATATVTPDELVAFLHLGRAVGKTLTSGAELVDKNFDEYRKFVIAKGRAQAADGRKETP